MSFCLLGNAQETQEDAVILPSVFRIGEFDHAFETLSKDHNTILLSVCGDNMDLAYERWIEMMMDVEDYADQINYDIKGVKVYMYVFWNADGSVAHLAFYPKPNSRNIPHEELTAFFKGFIKNYQIPLSSDQGFSHYGSASFPTFAKPQYRVKRDE
jgi:hypothetical protein